MVALAGLTAQGRVHLDEGGMPKCIESTGGGSGNGLLILWKHYRQYDRKIYAVDVNTAGRGRETSVFSCRDWPRVNADDILYLAAEIDPDRIAAEGLPGYEFDARTIRALKQAARGGDVYREEETGEEYLRKNPIGEFTSRLNERLTKKYGPYFVAEIFRAWFENRGRNPDVKARLLRHLEQLKKNPSAAKLEQRYAGILVLMAPGYLEAPATSRVKAFVEILRKSGIQTEMLQTDTTASVADNATRIARQIEQYLQQGRKLIVAGASKGVPEVLGALTELRPSGGGQILGMLNISGTVLGSYLVDWGLQLPLFPFVRGKIIDEAEKSGIPVGDVRPGFESQGTRFLEGYFKGRRAQLPGNIPYFQVIGAPDFTVSKEDGFARQLREELLDTRFFPKHAANDGMIEFPRTLIPESWVPVSYGVAINASHAIFDGTYHGHSLTEEKSREAVVRALMMTIADLL